METLWTLEVKKREWTGIHSIANQNTDAFCVHLESLQLPLLGTAAGPLEEEASTRMFLHSNTVFLLTYSPLPVHQAWLWIFTVLDQGPASL